MAQLLAGAAKRCITPSEDYLNRLAEENRKKGRVALDGVHEDIWLRVIVLSDGEEKIVICGTDLNHYPSPKLMNPRLVEKFGINPLGCILAGTSNHNAVGGARFGGEDNIVFAFDNPMPPSELSDEYGRFVHDMTEEAVAEAISKLEPAEMGVNKGMSYINCTRELPTPIGTITANNFHAPSDHELIVLTFKSLITGEVIGAFINHAVQCDFMTWNVTDGTYPKIMPDLGGEVSLFVERYNKNKFPVIWAVGCVGDQDPIVRSTNRVVEVNDEGIVTARQVVYNYKDNLLRMHCLSSTQGLEVIDLMNKTTNYTSEYSFKGAEVFRSIPGRKCYAGLKLPLVPGAKYDPVPLGRDIEYRFRLADICGVSFLGLNAFFYASHSLMIKDMLPTDNTVIMALHYGGLGYMPDVESEKNMGFGVGNTNQWSAQMTEDALKDGIEELRKEVFGE